MNLSQRAEDTPTHERWRVILVGRTGLDQTLRRDEHIELIRARDTIDAMGELSDPIDSESPDQAVVMVGSDAEPERRELDSFIAGLRLIDPTVRVLRVGEDHEAYDGSVDADAELETIVAAIRASEHPIEPASLRFVTPDGDTKAETEAGSQQVAPENPSIEDEPQALADPAEEPEPAADPEPTPGVTVVVTNEGFEHRAQAAFDDESPIHRAVIMGDDGDQAASPSSSSPDHSQRHAHFAGPHDDQPLAAAMLAGRPVMEAALERINTRLGRADIRFVQGDDPGAAEGVPVTVADQVAGTLVCDDPAWIRGGGRAVLGQQARWLSTWIRLEKQQAELRRCAFTDTLTGAWNRRYFTRFLDAAIEQSRQARQPLSVMLFDIDEFKHYNDAYGHAAGDDILVETVRLLKSVIRPSDRVCRVGGDEFVVIFYEPSGPRGADSKPLESVYQIACRFQKQICRHRFPKLGTEAMGTLTVSGGLASFPWDGHDAESLLEKADQLAMESKRQGKNAITLGPGAESVCHTKR